MISKEELQHIEKSGMVVRCVNCKKLWLFGGWKLSPEMRKVWTCGCKKYKPNPNPADFNEKE